MSNYNGSQFVRKTIESVLAQSYSNWEFIIVDDCSTDNSRDIINEFNDKRIIRLYLDHHEHMVYGFNYAISQARGDYIARIDDDDTWKCEKLEKQLDYMETHPECGACFSLVNVVDEFDNYLTEEETERVRFFKTENRSQSQWLRHFYFNGSCLCHTSVMMNREIIRTVGIYNYALIQIQDYDLWVRIAKKYPIYVVQEPLVNYRLLTSGRNVSAVSPLVTRRSNFEFAYVLSRYFDDISDEMFVKAFGDDFLRKGTTDHKELLCERALLLLRPVFCGNVQKLGGMEKLIDLLQNDETRRILREKYSITQLNFYELSLSPVFYENAEMQHPIKKESFLLKAKRTLNRVLK
jgi:glycosyltransferase involved in cell wall biosynthesis